jgi:hypothetical protein
MMIKNSTALIVLISLLAGTASCNLPSSSSETEGDLNVTQAYQTVEARLTQAVAQTPLATRTNTPTIVSSASPTLVPPTASITNTPNQPTNQSSPVPNCDLAAAGNPIDVTIPDDSQFQPGEAFTKVWRLQNAGTCTWDQNYALALFSGDGMGAVSNIPLEGQVAPNETVDVSVDLIAPEADGTYQGNWKLKNELGEWFGIGPNGGSAFWVRIIVGDVTTLTPSGTEISPTLTTEPAATDTNTPNVLVSGPVTMLIGDKLDLDTKGIDNDAEDMMFYEEGDGQLFVAPFGASQFAEMGAGPPTIEDCNSVSLVSTPYKIANIASGTYFCYLTNDSNYGWLQAVSSSIEAGEVNMQMLTWAAP